MVVVVMVVVAISLRIVMQREQQTRCSVFQCRCGFGCRRRRGYSHRVVCVDREEKKTLQRNKLPMPFPKGATKIRPEPTLLQTHKITVARKTGATQTESLACLHAGVKIPVARGPSTIADTKSNPPQQHTAFSFMSHSTSHLVHDWSTKNKHHPKIETPSDLTGCCRHIAFCPSIRLACRCVLGEMDACVNVLEGQTFPGAEKPQRKGRRKKAGTIVPGGYPN